MSHRRTTRRRAIQRARRMRILFGPVVVEPGGLLTYYPPIGDPRPPVFIFNRWWFRLVVGRELPRPLPKRLSRQLREDI